MKIVHALYFSTALVVASSASAEEVIYCPFHGSTGDTYENREGFRFQLFGMTKTMALTADGTLMCVNQEDQIVFRDLGDRTCFLVARGGEIVPSRDGIWGPTPTVCQSEGERLGDCMAVCS